MLLQYHISTVYLFVFMYYLYKKNKLFFSFLSQKPVFVPLVANSYLKKERIQYQEQKPDCTEGEGRSALRAGRL